MRIKGQLTLDDFKKSFEEKAKELQIPIAFKPDEVKSGCLGMTRQNCLIIFHPEEKAWSKVCLRITAQGIYTLANFDWVVGKGIQHLITNQGEELKSGGSITGRIAGGILKSVTAKKDNDMHNWFSALLIVLNEAMENEGE